MIYGIDVNALTRPNYTGVERYVFGLITEMIKQPLKEGERVFLYASKQVDALGDLPEGWEWKVLKLPMLSKGWTHVRLSWELFVHAPDVFFSPAHEVPLVHRRSKIMNTVHDIAFVHVPEVYSFLGRLRQRWAIRHAVRVSDRILTVSETTKMDIKEYYNVSPDRMRVTHLGIQTEEFQVGDQDIEFVLEKHDLQAQEYFVTIGRIEKKKGIDFLIRVFEKFKQKYPKSKKQLVLGGAFGHGQEDIKKQIIESPVKDQIHVLGFVPQEDLAALIAGAQAYLFPSRYEGFGIPALEAMAAGTPVLASNTPALQEVCADAAITLSVDQISEWVRALEQMNDESIRQDLVRRGARRAEEFTWRKTAKKTWGALRELV